MIFSGRYIKGRWPAIGVIIIALGACVPDLEIPGFDESLSQAALDRGYPALMPISFFNMAAVTPIATGNLAGRAAALRGKIRALSEPVIAPRDRARLEAALHRHNKG